MVKNKIKKILIFVFTAVFFGILQAKAFETFPVLYEIKMYQSEYFLTIKGSEVLFFADNQMEEQKAARERLEKLFSKLESKISPDSPYKEHYDNIESFYSEKYPEMTYGNLREILERELKAYDDLYDEIYQEIRNKISKKELKKLDANENRWLEAVGAYYRDIEEKYGEKIKEDMYFAYEINATKFRILLFLLYFNSETSQAFSPKRTSDPHWH